MTSIDTNRINLIETAAYDFAEQTAPINPDDVPMYSTTELKSVEVDVNSPQNQEELEDLARYGIRTVAYYKNEATNNPTYNSNIAGAPDLIYARSGVAKKLQEANRKLAPMGLEVIVYDAHRSPATQKKLYMHFVRVAYEKGLKGQEAQDFAAQYCSNPDGFDKENPKTWTMHSTGAAVDVYLFDKKSGKVVDMGEGYFDNPDEVTHTQYYENLAKKRPLNKEEQSYLAARRILFNTMKDCGFYNYGSELFHYELDGLIAAKVKSEEGIMHKARYGYQQSPSDNAKANILGSLVLHAQGKE